MTVCSLSMPGARAATLSVVCADAPQGSGHVLLGSRQCKFRRPRYCRI